MPEPASFCQPSALFSRSSSGALRERGCSNARAPSSSLGGCVDLPHDGGSLSSVPLLPSVAAGLVACFGGRRALCHVLGVFLVRLFSSRALRFGDRDSLHVVHLRPRSIATVAATVADGISFHHFWRRTSGQPICLERYPALFHRRRTWLADVTRRTAIGASRLTLSSKSVVINCLRTCGFSAIRVLLVLHCMIQWGLSKRLLRVGRFCLFSLDRDGYPANFVFVPNAR